MKRHILSLTSALLIVGSCSSAPDATEDNTFVAAATVEATATDPGGTVAPAADPGRSDILPYDATETTLANGLKVIVVPTGYPNSSPSRSRSRPARATRSRRARPASRTSSST